MQQIRKIQDLTKFGITILPQEKDSLELRGWYGLTKKGRIVIKQFFKVYDTSKTGKILLPYSIMIDLAVFCLFFCYGVDYVAIVDSAVYGMSEDEYVTVKNDIMFSGKNTKFIKRPHDFTTYYVFYGEQFDTNQNNKIQ